MTTGATSSNSGRIGRRTEFTSATAGQVFRQLMRTAIRRTTSDRLLGPLWWLIDPLVLIAVYALVFGEFLGLRKGPGGTPDYPLFLACGLVAWRAFSTSTAFGASAFQRNATLLTSVPISRHAVVLSEQAAGMVQGLAGLVVLVAFMLVYGRPVTLNLFWLPVPLVALAVLSVGTSYLLCPFTSLVPDIANAWAAFLRLVFFLSPGLYGLDRVPESMRAWYVALNPLAGILEGVRRPIYDGLPPEWGALGWSMLWALVLLAIGRYAFDRLSPSAIRRL